MKRDTLGYIDVVAFVFGALVVGITFLLIAFGG